MSDSKFKVLDIATGSKDQLVNITGLVNDVVVKSGVMDGVCHVFVPHTTAAVTINENADPDVPLDIIRGLNDLVPDSRKFRHAEGNSPAHIKALLVGNSVSVIIDKGRLVMGTWQGIFFCEFDGPRQRKIFIKVT